MQNEDHIDLTEAAKRSPGRPSPSAVWRWCRRGIKGRSGERVKLEHIRVGGRIYTTGESLSRFFTAVAEADSAHFDHRRETPTKATSRTEAQRKRAIERAEAELAEAGI